MAVPRAPAIQLTMDPGVIPPPPVPPMSASGGPTPQGLSRVNGTGGTHSLETSPSFGCSPNPLGVPFVGPLDYSWSGPGTCNGQGTNVVSFTVDVHDNDNYTAFVSCTVTDTGYAGPGTRSAGSNLMRLLVVSA